MQNQSSQSPQRKEIIQINGTEFVVHRDELLGKGSYGEVYKAYKCIYGEEDKTLPFAVKVFSREQFAIDFIENVLTNRQPLFDPYFHRATIAQWKTEYESLKASVVQDNTQAATFAKNCFDALDTLDPVLKNYLVTIQAKQSIDNCLNTEALICKHVYPNQSGRLDSENNSYLIMRFIPGKPLEDQKGNRHSELKDLSLADRLELVNKIVKQLWIFHNLGRNTQGYKKAVLHRDLKGTNVMIQVTDPDTKEKDLQASIIDFGCSTMLEVGNEIKNTLFSSLMKGNPLYFPLETLNKPLFGIKTDIYMLNYVIALLLAPRVNPLRHKGAETTDEACAKAKFCFEPMVDFPKIADIDLKNVLLSFLDRMQHNDYLKRPATTEVANFFQVLLETVTLAEADKNNGENQTELRKNAASLMLMAGGISEEKQGALIKTDEEVKKIINLSGEFYANKIFCEETFKEALKEDSRIEVLTQQHEKLSCIRLLKKLDLMTANTVDFVSKIQNKDSLTLFKTFIESLNKEFVLKDSFIDCVTQSEAALKQFVGAPDQTLAYLLLLKPEESGLALEQLEVKRKNKLANRFKSLKPLYEQFGKEHLDALEKKLAPFETNISQASVGGSSSSHFNHQKPLPKRPASRGRDISAIAFRPQFNQNP